MIEGIDFSRTDGIGSPSVAALKANGKRFVGRYAVNDLSPNGRGISAAEYLKWKAGGIEVFLYWESSEGWMTDGFAAGAVAAVNAQQNINRAGLPPTMPVYFACDFDAAESDQDAIDDCLRGCADVFGPARVGIYGGYHVVKRCAEHKTAAWFCQTLAWSGGNWYPGNHLEQYDTQGNFIDGTDVDLVRAMQPNYGQASKFLTIPTPDPIPEPVYAKPAAISWKHGDTGVHDLNGTPALAFLLEVKCISPKGTVPVQSSAPSAKPTGPKIEPNEKRVAVGAYRGGPHRNAYVVLDDGSRVIRSKFRPLVPLPPVAA